MCNVHVNMFCRLFFSLLGLTFACFFTYLSFVELQILVQNNLDILPRHTLFLFHFRNDYFFSCLFFFLSILPMLFSSLFTFVFFLIFFVNYYFVLIVFFCSLYLFWCRRRVSTHWFTLHSSRTYFSSIHTRTYYVQNVVPSTPSDNKKKILYTSGLSRARLYTSVVSK